MTPNPSQTDETVIQLPVGYCMNLLESFCQDLSSEDKGEILKRVASTIDFGMARLLAKMDRSERRHLIRCILAQDPAMADKIIRLFSADCTEPATYLPECTAIMRDIPELWPDGLNLHNHPKQGDCIDDGPAKTSERQGVPDPAA